MEERIKFIDTAKGLAIIAVVLSHGITNNSNVFLVNYPALLNWLSFFNVSTFFFINGYLYKETTVSTPVKSIIKRFKSYYIPYVSFNLFFVLFHNPLYYAHLLEDSDGAYNIKTFFVAIIKALLGKMQPLTGPMWFLRALIILSIIYIIIDSMSSRFLDGKYRYRINGIACCVIFILASLRIFPGTYNFSYACDSLIVFYFGIIFKQFDLNKYILKYKLPILVISFTMSFVLGITCYVGLQRHSNLLLNLICSIISLLFIISLAQINIISNCKLICLFGRASLEIMALHFFAFKPISFIIVKLYNLPIDQLSSIPVIKLPVVSFSWQILYTITGIVLPTFFYQVKNFLKNQEKYNS